MSSSRISFTKASLSELPAKSKLQTVYDDKARGLCLLITPKGVKTFYVLRKFKGKTERVKLGRFPDMPVALARRQAAEVTLQFELGQNPNQQKRADRDELSLKDLHRLYMEKHCYVRNRRPEKQEDHFRLYLSHWSTRRLSDITKIDVQAWHARLGEDKGQRTANIALALLRAMYNRAIDWDLFAGANPTQGTRKFKEPSRERFLLPNELKRLLEALRDEPETFRDLVLILLLTGVRKTNALQMRWQDIDLEDAVWRIPETKNGDPLLLPLSSYAVELLRRRLETQCVAMNQEKLPPVRGGVSEPPGISGGEFPGSPASRAEFSGAPGTGYPLWVFPGAGASGHLKDPKKAWRSLLQKAAIADFRMHDLRRTHGSYMAATGVNQTVIQRALGHKDPQTTAIYTRLDLDPVRSAATLATESMAAHAPELLAVGQDRK